MEGRYSPHQGILQVTTKLILGHWFLYSGDFLESLGLHEVKEGDEPRGVLGRSSGVVGQTEFNYVKFADQILSRIAHLIPGVVDL
jgi:hypothetical protein